MKYQRINKKAFSFLKTTESSKTSVYCFSECLCSALLGGGADGAGGKTRLLQAVVPPCRQGGGGGEPGGGTEEGGETHTVTSLISQSSAHAPYQSEVQGYFTIPKHV